MGLPAETGLLLDLSSLVSSRLQAAGSWALRIPAKPLLKFYVVLRGQCWITLPDQPPRLLADGDSFLLNNSPSFQLAALPETTPEGDFHVVKSTHSARFRYGGDDTEIISVGVLLNDGAGNLVGSMLPVFSHVSGVEPVARLLRTTVTALGDELGSERLGASLMASSLANVLLVQALRVCTEGESEAGKGWVKGLGDPQIGKAMHLMHGQIERSWTVDKLALAVGMSRSAFALRFKQVVGVAPLEYLTHWRMHIARNALRNRHISAASIAFSLGYSSESAFSSAFKRNHGRAPRHYRDLNT